MPKPAPSWGERLVLTQVDQGEKSLLEATEPAPTSLACATVLVQQPGNMLDELVGDVQHGWLRNQQGLAGRRCAEWNHHANDEGPCLVTTTTDQSISPLQPRMKEAQSRAKSPELVDSGVLRGHPAHRSLEAVDRGSAEFRPKVQAPKR